MGAPLTVWTVWGDWTFVVPIALFFITIVATLYFEAKYLDERRKNRELQRLITKMNADKKRLP